MNIENSVTSLPSWQKTTIWRQVMCKQRSLADKRQFQLVSRDWNSKLYHVARRRRTKAHEVLVKPLG